MGSIKFDRNNASWDGPKRPKEPKLWDFKWVILGSIKMFRDAPRPAEATFDTLAGE